MSGARRGGRWALSTAARGAPSPRASAAGLPFLADWRGPLALASAGLIVPSCADLLEQEADPADVASLNLQQARGWSVGDEHRPLALPGATDADAIGGAGWKTALTQLPPRLAPSDPRWEPFYAPALFQALQAPRNDDLRALIRPVHTPAMVAAQQRGAALLSLFDARVAPPPPPPLPGAAPAAAGAAPTRAAVAPGPSAAGDDDEDGDGDGDGEEGAAAAATTTGPASPDGGVDRDGGAGPAAAAGAAVSSAAAPSPLVQAGCRGDVAVVLDLPGPESIAAAAALGPCFDPVFVFDNWPHPAGVVPSQLTLGAVLYYLPVFEGQRMRRPAQAPPVFVLDRHRLNPYVDEAMQFDNRYFARLPPAGALAAAGVRQILYVTPDATVTMESDDLNEPFVELAAAGIDVRMLALADFLPELPLPSPADGGAPPSAGDAAADPAVDLAVDPFLGPFPEPLPEPEPLGPYASLDIDFRGRLFFGGSRRLHRSFWAWYGPRVRSAPPLRGVPAPREAPPLRGMPGPGPPRLPMPLTGRQQYHPVPRFTMLGPGVGHHSTVGGTHHAGGGGHGSYRSGTFGRIGGFGHFG